MSSGPGADRRERLARLYDAEILPAYAARFARLALRLVAPRPAARVLEIGCATGHLTLELARRFDGARRIIAVDDKEELLAEAHIKLAAARADGAPLDLRVAASLTRLPVEDGVADVVVSNLAVAESDDPRGAAAELARALAPGGQAVLTAPLRGTWSEFVDLFQDVLRDGGKGGYLDALESYARSFPTGDEVCRWLEEAGLVDVAIEVEHWELLFRSAREFFFAPLVELGPLSRWKQIIGRGDEMQDAFFFTKEAIDTYFKGRPFAVTVLGAAVTARKPAGG